MKHAEMCLEMLPDMDWQPPAKLGSFSGTNDLFELTVQWGGVQLFRRQGTISTYIDSYYIKDHQSSLRLCLQGAIDRMGLERRAAAADALKKENEELKQEIEKLRAGWLVKLEEPEDFRFLITYFKPSGKYYGSDEVVWKIKAIGPDRHRIPYIYDAVDKLEALRDSGVAGSLPGLSGTGWDGPILLQHLDGTEDGGSMHLLMPRTGEM